MDQLLVKRTLPLYFYLSMYRRYKSNGSAAGKENTATLFLLLDIATFFDLYHAGRSTEALSTIEKVKVVIYLSIYVMNDIQDMKYYIKFHQILSL